MNVLSTFGGTAVLESPRPGAKAATGEKMSIEHITVIISRAIPEGPFPFNDDLERGSSYIDLDGVSDNSISGRTVSLERPSEL